MVFSRYSTAGRLGAATGFDISSILGTFLPGLGPQQQPAAPVVQPTPPPSEWPIVLGIGGLVFGGLALVVAISARERTRRAMP